MSAWPKDELRKIAEADDLHISPFRDDGETTAPRRGSGPSRSMTASTCGPQRAELPLVQAAVRQKAGRITAAGMTKEVDLRAGRRTDQRPHRRRLSGEVPREPLSQPDDRGPRPLRHGQDQPA